MAQWSLVWRCGLYDSIFKTKSVLRIMKSNEYNFTFGYLTRFASNSGEDLPVDPHLH